MGEESGCLRFETQDDAIDFARHSAEDGRRWAVERGFSCANDYLKGKAEIHVDVASLANSGKFKLVAQFAPFVDEQFDRTFYASSFLNMHLGPFIAIGYSKDALVFSLTGKTTDQIEESIPVVIGLQTLNESDEFCGEAATFPANFALEVTKTFSKWKINPIEISNSQQGGGVAHCVVKGVAEVCDDTSRSLADHSRNALTEAELYNLLFCVRINVRDGIVTAAIREHLARDFEVIRAFFGAIEH